LNDQTSLDAGRVQDLLRRLFETGRGTKRANWKEQSDSQAKPTPRHASVPDNCCDLLNKFHTANLISIRICVNGTLSGHLKEGGPFKDTIIVQDVANSK
jgi:hypothetical protein